jgi:epoxyqueuosine reductase
MTIIDRTQAVKRRATELGFDACGIAAADPIDPQNRLGEWLDRGYHGTMDWMNRTRELRQEVQRKRPGTRSVIVVARNYYADRPAADRDTGRVSRYAWGRDYHRVLRKPLRALAEMVDAMESGAESYCCIDSGPVMEKAWAVRAGIGWLGKNTLVLNNELGSWFFLATILTTVELEPDAPIADQCGGCRLCLDACPTEALIEPQLLDATKCISYQTIENRGDVPEDIARDHDDWVFGCDVCQEVCPWNRTPQITDETDFYPREGHANPDLELLENLNEQSFLEEFAGTPIMRAKQEGIKRNAAIARNNASKRTRVLR